MRIVFLGDSITERWDLSLVGSNLINAGISSNRTADMSSRLWQDVLQYDPDKVVILGGINDIFFGPAWNVATLCAMARQVTKYGGHPYVCTLLPCSNFTNWPYIANLAAGKAAVAAMNSAIRGNAAGFGYTAIDCYPSFVDGSDNQLASLFESDGLHVSTAGYAVLGPIVSAALG